MSGIQSAVTWQKSSRFKGLIGCVELIQLNCRIKLKVNVHVYTVGQKVSPY